MSVLIRLTRKFADVVDDVDLRPYRVGEVLRMPRRPAFLLLAEGWAELIERRRTTEQRPENFERRRESLSSF